jgi:hypothetical protein
MQDSKRWLAGILHPGLANLRILLVAALIKQRADLRAVIDVVGRQRRRDDLAAIGIHTDVQFACVRLHHIPTSSSPDAAASGCGGGDRH